MESGDDIAFLQLDANGNSLGYRTFSSNSATKFNMDNDPAGTTHGPGHVGNLFTASNGDLIVVEEGYDDLASSTTGQYVNGLTNSEPAVIRGAVNYDDSGKITITWGQKMFLSPAKQFDTSKGAPSTFKTDGWFSAYDPSTNKVYFADPGSSNFNPQFEMSWYALDLATGVTSSFMNMDESVSLFVSNSNFPNGDKVVAFTVGRGGRLQWQWHRRCGRLRCSGEITSARAFALLNRDPNASGPISAADYDLME